MAAAKKGSQPIGPVTQLLIKARTKVADPKTWARGKYGQDALGNPVRPEDETCVRWCGAGALQWAAGLQVFHAAQNGSHNEYHTAHALLEKAGPGSVTWINDGSGRERMLEVYNKAIVLAAKDKL